MRNDETGEYELVVGNRQLLGGFFIVVLLCAAAFAMGYVVGENTHTSRPMETALSPNGPKPMDATPDAPDARAASPSPAAPSSPLPDVPPDSKGAAETAAAASSPQPVTQPAREPEPPPPVRREPATAPAPRAVAESAPGQYWQVTATSNRNSAETLVQSLRDKGFPAVLSSGADNLTHVMVGPYKDTASLGRAKTDLENNGFTQLVRK